MKAIMARLLAAAAALRGLCCSRRRAWASSVSPARALESEAVLAACLALVASSFSLARALACRALSAACLACLAVSSSFSRLSLSLIFSCRDGSTSLLSFHSINGRLYAPFFSWLWGPHLHRFHSLPGVQLGG